MNNILRTAPPATPPDVPVIHLHAVHRFCPDTLAAVYAGTAWCRIAAHTNLAVYGDDRPRFCPVAPYVTGEYVLPAGWRWATTEDAVPAEDHHLTDPRPLDKLHPEGAWEFPCVCHTVTLGLDREQAEQAFGEHLSAAAHAGGAAA